MVCRPYARGRAAEALDHSNIGELMQHIPDVPVSKGPAERFTGEVYATYLSAPEKEPHLAAGVVRFAPGARTNWHVHETGQTLFIVEGEAVVATRDGSVVHARAGDLIQCAPQEEHWHGATQNVVMTHIAMVVAPAGGAGTVWLEPVTEEQYSTALVR